MACLAKYRRNKKMLKGSLFYGNALINPIISKKCWKKQRNEITYTSGEFGDSILIIFEKAVCIFSTFYTYFVAFVIVVIVHF